MKRVITQQQFLIEREMWRRHVANNAGDRDIIHDPGDEIICDLCNGDILNDVTILGDMAMCEECVIRCEAENAPVN